VDALQAAWDDLLPDAPALGADLLRRWTEPWRHYHDAEHLSDVLTALDDLAAPAPVNIRLAAWFHDAIYEPRAGDNEERSAALAASTLRAASIHPADVAEVVRLVRLTASHDPGPDDPAGALLCDADLAILGSPSARYRRYVAAVRREYAHVPDDEFRVGRSRILRGFLRRPAIFRTEAGRARWESTARRNLNAELDDDAGRPR
jgi:predicted metal-dependent HD superfamily phosphohydrolase